MLVGLLVFFGIVVAVIWLVAAYNSLVVVKQRVTQTWANIDALLRQRHDEVPKLIETCQQHVRFEQETFDRVLETRTTIFGARQTQDAETLGRAEGDLRSQLGKLFALAEAYPELKADQAFVVLQQRITALENGISERGQLYNEAVNQNNAAIEQFPGSLVASIGGFRAFRPFDLPER